MDLPVVAAVYITFEGVLHALIWLAFAAMAFWAWSAGKAQAALMTLVGAGLIGLTALLALFGVFIVGMWPMVVGSALVAYGYFLTVKPIVMAEVAKLKAKASGGGGSPPSA